MRLAERQGDNMNRRTFLKALIGIPALLIAGKMPKVGREAVKDIDYTGWKFYGGYDVDDDVMSLLGPIWVSRRLPNDQD